MDTRLKLMLSTLPEKMVDSSFIQLRAIADGRELVMLPLWDREGFEVRYKGGQSKELTREQILAVLEEHIGKAQTVEVVHTERTSETTVELNAGKVRTRIGAPKSGKPDATNAPRAHQEVVAAGTRQAFIKAAEAKDMLTAIGIMASDGEIKGDKRRKFYQIDRFIELITNMLERWPENEELVVLDCGCGKSYLSFALNYYLYEKLGKKCRFIGIDNNPDVIESSRKIQQQLNYRNMEFVAADVQSYEPKRQIHMVLSLHACDTATDQAIALGLRCKSKYIIAVPCCQTALTEELDYGPLASMMKHNVFKKRLADLITDGLRAAALEAHGYTVSVAEYVSPLDPPKTS